MKGNIIDTEKNKLTQNFIGVPVSIQLQSCGTEIENEIKYTSAQCIKKNIHTTNSHMVNKNGQ